MFEKTLHTKTKSILKNIGSFASEKNLYLAGGTALALQLGHRLSVDLDFFSQEDLDTKKLKKDLSESGFKYKINNETTGTLELVMDDVKISFMEYRYPLLKDFEIFEKNKLASVLDIAAMKVTAISSRGSKKDFVDIWMILQKYEPVEIFDAVRKKYQNANYSTAHLLKSLTYFKDAESDPDPRLVVETNWEEIKKDITEKIVPFNKTS